MKNIKNIQDTFWELITALSNYGAAPTEYEFREIVNGRNLKRDNPLYDFLRERTVKKYPVIDNLPITAFMKMTMIELPKECDHIFSLMKLLPQSNISNIVDEFISQNKQWFKKNIQ